jgi:Amt family ammonium transporter
VNHLRRAAHIVKELKSMGFRFALDDFGSGMSSFAYLKNLPVDYLKIDGGFVREMDKDPVSRSMVAAINQIGHAMGLKTIAEWVENEAVLDELREIGVDFAQGYAIGRPSPLPDGPVAAAPQAVVA